ncbi:phage tail tape measure protein, partial [Escherichia coli]|uniref:phage tail tape measure protein n=1 Tax=Escherichia coli TaxID=562 RepID=UPI000C1B7413
KAWDALKELGVKTSDIEETAAMVGALHDAKITGSMAGTGSRAVLSRLQAPTGKAWDALKELGVKTSDIEETAAMVGALHDAKITG